MGDLLKHFVVLYLAAFTLPHVLIAESVLKEMKVSGAYAS